ncbi:MAG TPA: sigma-70 family RNA polymerase sigma factor [Solirubrobacterales bacterium]
MRSVKPGEPLQDEELREIARSLHGKLKAHRLSESFIERFSEEAIQKGMVDYLRAVERGVVVENREAFVVQAAFRRAIDEVRREARLADGAAIEALLSGLNLAEPASEEIALEHLAAQELHEAISSLPAEERAALRLHYFDELSAEKSAKAMFCGEGTYRRRLDKARRTMSRRLGVPIPEPGSDLAIEIGMAAWVSLRGADVAIAHGLPEHFLAVLDRGRDAVGWVLDRLRNPAARLGAAEGGERIGAVASGPVGKVAGCAAAACLLGGAIGAEVGGPGNLFGHHDPRPAHVGRRANIPTARMAVKPQVPSTPSRVSHPVTSQSQPAASRTEPTPAQRRRAARRSEERQVEEQMSAMSRIASEAESEPSSSGASAAAAPEAESVTVAPSGGSSGTSAASEEAQAEKQFGAFK